jgi:hypothetical protein
MTKKEVLLKVAKKSKEECKESDPNEKKKSFLEMFKNKKNKK